MTTPRSAPAAALVGMALLATLTAGCAPPSDSSEEGGFVASPTDIADLAAFAASIPAAEVPEFDLEMGLTLAAMPLSCLDRPHATASDRRTYLDTLVASRVPGYEDSRAFYGCWDWHSAANSTWAMVRIQKAFPDIGVSGLIEEKLNDHLSEAALQGELAFFQEDARFERPYGWAWLLYLHAELSTWDHPDADAWTANVEPLARLFSERTLEWLEDLKVPSRSGAHANTAFSMAMMLEAARITRDRPLQIALEAAARRFFEDDFGCPTAYEPWGSDFLSPCLEEAALMAAVFERPEYLVWLDDFLPALPSREFAPLTRPTDPGDVVEAVRDAPEPPLAPLESNAPGESAEGDEDTARRDAAELRFLASSSHLIGLAFIRADAINRIVQALPAEDPRVQALRKIARLHAARGFQAMFEADYAGSHWIGTFAVKYLLTEAAAGG